MTSDHEPDALSLWLARLPSAAPNPDRDARIKSRCHAVLTSRSAKRPHALRSRTVIASLGNAALGALLCAYAALALLEAARLPLVP
jgi:hypothetical protein